MKVISVENVSKKFILAHDRPKNLVEASRAMFQRKEREDFWALKDVSFEVEQGEALGIIGHNGAGKSTMLKILTGIMQPNKGHIRTRGRVSALIEVGAGFHPEMTGRENIYLNGSILGMRKAEIDRKFDEIVAFAELEKFIDTPVKRYSSGMYARLGFAVAANVNPDILIVDEVLAVGDAQFQKKCLGKMGEVKDSQGRAIVFVSHNMVAVQALCGRALLLDNGRVIDEGNPQTVASRYLGGLFNAMPEQVWDDSEAAPGNETVRLRRVSAMPCGGSLGEPLTIKTPIMLEFDYWNREPGAMLTLSLHVFNEEGVRLFNTAPIRDRVWTGKPMPVGLYRSSCVIPADLLNDGLHSVELLVVRNRSHVIFGMPNALTFSVLDVPDEDRTWFGKWVGAVRPGLPWETRLLREDTVSIHVAG